MSNVSLVRVLVPVLVFLPVGVLLRVVVVSSYPNPKSTVFTSVLASAPVQISDHDPHTTGLKPSLPSLEVLLDV